MNELRKLLLGGLMILLMVVAVWVAWTLIFRPELDRGARQRGHTLGEYFDRLLGR